LPIIAQANPVTAATHLNHMGINAGFTLPMIKIVVVTKKIYQNHFGIVLLP
jgi:hypothetical protein